MRMKVFFFFLFFIFLGGGGVGRQKSKISYLNNKKKMITSEIFHFCFHFTCDLPDVCIVGFELLSSKVSQSILIP